MTRATFALSVSVLALGLGALPARAQTDTTPSVDSTDAPKAKRDKSKDKDRSGDITVTGSRIKDPVLTEKTIIITEGDIKRSGASTISQLIQQLPQNTNSVTPSVNTAVTGALASGVSSYNNNGSASFNLRGLGVTSTLVLINGRRTARSSSSTGEYNDVAGIPLESIQRIEIYSGGASAIYGADAVGGVVNIILKDKYNGLTLKARGGLSQYGANDWTVSGSGGFSWGSGNAVLGATYTKTLAIKGAKFGYRNRDYTALGGFNFEQSSEYGLFQDIYVAPYTVYQRPKGVAGPYTTNQFVTGSAIDYGDNYPLYLSPLTKQLSLSGSATQKILSGVTLGLDARWTKRDTNTIGAIPFLSPYSYTLSATNPNNPFPGKTTGFGYIFTREVDAGIVPRPTNIGSTVQWETGANLGVDISSNWKLTLDASYSRETNRALGTVLDTAAVASSFRSGGLSVNSPSYLDAASAAILRADVDADLLSAYTSAQWTTEATVNGALFNLPAGPVKVAFGGQYRRERFTSASVAPTRPLTTSAGYASRGVKALFGEAQLPIFGTKNAIPGFRELVLTGAVRREDYNDDVLVKNFNYITNVIGASESSINRDTTVFKVGGAWRPITSVRLIANWSQSFVAPTLAQLAYPSVTYNGQTFDPNAPGGARVVGPITIISGNSLGLKNQTATNLTAGIEISPNFAPGLVASANYYKIHYDNRITSLPAGYILKNQAFFPDFVKRDTSGNLTSYTEPASVNALIEVVRGLDFELRYSFGLVGGSARIDANATRIISDRQQFLAAVASTEIAGTFYGGGQKWAMRTVFDWDRGNFGLTAAINYRGGYLINTQYTIGPQAITLNTVPSVTTADLQLHYQPQFLNGARFTVGATNILGKKPPFANIATGVSGLNYDLRGRVVYAEISKSF